MSQYPPQDPNYPYQSGQSGPYGAPDPYGQPQPPQTPYPQQSGGYGAPQPPSQYGQQQAYPGYPPAQQPQYPQAPAQPQYPGYGVPGQPSQYGAPAPQSQWGYPQGQPMGPGFPGGGPGMPPAQPSSNRGAITGIAIAAAVVILVVVGVLVLKSLNSVSYQGQWYGKSQLHANSSGTNISAQVEVYMNLTQDGSGNISGTGKLCANAGSSAQDIATFTVSGSATNSPATLAWDDTSGKTTGTASISSQQMSITMSDPGGTGTLSGTLQQGGQDKYTSECATLAPVTGASQ